MRTQLLLSIFLLTLGNVNAQKEKIKGNKIISTEEYEVENFHSIEIYEGFEVAFEESSDNLIKIETDSNIQREIKVEVIDGVLKITSDKDLRRTKVLNLDINYASELKKIKIYDRVNIKSLSSINTTDLELEVNDNAEMFLTVEANKVTCIAYGKSTAELHLTTNEAVYQINENSEIKGIVTSDSLKVDLYQKGSAKLEGEIKSMLIRADNDTDFYGEKLNVAKTSLIAEGATDCYILTNEEITIEAIDKAEIFLLGEPKINIKTFSNEATLFKKNIDYVPSKLRLN